jgi:hypothetical protein
MMVLLLMMMMHECGAVGKTKAPACGGKQFKFIPVDDMLTSCLSGRGKGPKQISEWKTKQVLRAKLPVQGFCMQ